MAGDDETPRLETARSALARQLFTLLRVLVPINLGAVVFMLAIYAFFIRRPMFISLAVLIGLNALSLIAARLRLDRDDVRGATILTATGNWIVVVGIVFTIPQVLAIMVVVGMLPVMLVMAYVEGRNARLLIGSAVVMVALMAAISSLVDVFDVTSDPDAEFLIDGATIGVLPILVGLTFYMHWSQQRRINAAIEAEREANAHLRQNELQLERTVAERTAQLAAARDDALAAAQAKSAFLATMSHEIRTPLNGVLGMNSLLLETQLSDQQREFARTIEASGSALLSVLNDILDYSKIEAGRLELEAVPFTVRDMIEETADMVAVTAAAKGLELAYYVDPEVPAAVIGDPGRLRQILLNLLNNAVKFTSAGEVVLGVAVEGSEAAGSEADSCRLRLEVRDTGSGIPPDRLDSLFEEFTQLDTSTTRRFGGTGLGLAISRRLAALMDGDVSAASSGVDGEGSTFTVIIRVETTEPVEPIVPIDLQHRPVLLVDDNATNLQILEMQTQSWGLEPTAISDPQAAAHAVEDGARFDLALLDLHMPDLDGAQLATRLHAADPAMPMLILSSLGSDEIAPPEGVRSILTKPVRPSSLFDAVITALDDGTTPPDPGRRVVTAAAARSQDRTVADSHPLSILVADDNEVNRRLIRYVLEGLGYSPTLVENGEEALRAAVAGTFDVVLMDMQMPVMDGLEAAGRIRDHESLEGRRPRVIAMTANVMQEDRERCAAAGMTGFLGKPLDKEEVAAELRRTSILEGSRGTDGADPERPEPHQPPDVIDLTDAPQTTTPPATAAALARLKETVGGDAALVHEIIGSFLADAPAAISALAATSAAGDHAELQRHAHSLKGNARLFGHDALAESAQRLEEAVGDASADELILDLVDTVTHQCRDLVADLEGSLE